MSSTELLQHPSLQATTGFRVVASERAKITTVYLVMALATVLLAYFILGIEQLPLGTFWLDYFAFDGVAVAMAEGAVPGRDFWSPMVLPHYLFYWAGLWDNDGSLYLLLHLLQWSLLFGLSALILPARFKPQVCLLLLSALLLFAMSPFNFSHLSWERTGLIAYNCFYNRFGGLCLALLFLMASPPRPGASGLFLCNALFAGLLLIISFYTKMSLFLIVVVMLCYYAIAGLGGLRGRDLLIGGLLFLLVYLAVELNGGYASLYLDNLRYIASIRQSGILERLTLTLPGLLNQHAGELVLLAMVAACLVLHQCGRGIGVRGLISAPLIFFTMASGGVLLFTFTNNGDFGLLPLTFAYVALAYLLFVQQGSELRLPWYHRLVPMLVMILAFYVGMSYGNDTRKHWRKIHQDVRDSVYISQLFQAEYLNERFVIHPATVAEAAAFDGDLYQREAISLDARYLLWLQSVDQTVEEFNLRALGDADRVYALTFSAYIFSLLTDLKSPAGAFPWLLYDESVSEHRKPDAHSFFYHVDYLLTEKCPLHSPWDVSLYSLYEDFINSQYTMLQENDCWVMWQRNHHLATRTEADSVNSATPSL